MDSWILTAQEAVRRSPVICEELRAEGEKMLRDGERDAVRRIFVDILEEPMPVSALTVPSGGGYKAPTVL
ncbi:MAG: hypothetical protein F4X64_05790 [Chloroflexi bacterium]|nr:hypothetical protein [Chloroflexota bacterium]